MGRILKTDHFAIFPNGLLLPQNLKGKDGQCNHVVFGVTT